MTTIADNVRSMAALVHEVKKRHQLSETTILRIIDMTFALAQNPSQSLDSPDDLDLDDNLAVFPVNGEEDTVEDDEPTEAEEPDALATIKPN